MREGVIVAGLYPRLESLLSPPSRSLLACIRADLAKIREELRRNHVLRAELNGLYLRIEPTYPPNRILQTLLPLLQKHHENLPHLPSLKTPVHSLKTWLGYFRCYDLRRCAKSFGEIAREVYGSNKRHDLAKKAYKRAKRLIQSAGEHWALP